jgi:hypothetical protein
MTKSRKRLWRTPILSVLAISTLVNYSNAIAKPTADTVKSPLNQQVDVEWKTSPVLAGEVASSLKLSGENIKPIQDPSATPSKGLPLIAIVVGAAVFKDLSRALLDVWKNSWPGVVVQRDANGKFKITPDKSLPPGCVIYDYGKTQSQCMFTPSNLGKDPSTVLTAYMNKGIK